MQLHLQYAPELVRFWVQVPSSVTVASLRCQCSTSSNVTRISVLIARAINSRDSTRGHTAKLGDSSYDLPVEVSTMVISPRVTMNS